jgi:hypothetical protein
MSGVDSANMLGGFLATWAFRTCGVDEDHGRDAHATMCGPWRETVRRLS